MRIRGLALALLALSGCEGPGFAPIRDNAPPPAKTVVKPAAKQVTAATVPEPSQAGRHIVQPGDTLFSIAFQNGLDYRDLASWNSLASPDLIKVGQVLRLAPPEDPERRTKGVEIVPMRDAALSRPKPIEADPPLLTEPRAQRLPYSEANWAVVFAAKPAVVANQPKSPQAAQAATAIPSSPGEQDDWRWPAEGTVLGTFGQGGGKGIDIAGARNSPVLSAAPGKVVYSGTGLRGYGKMLIVKHSEEFLTAYAHNQALLAKEGEWVRGGQKIAEMGDTDSDQVKLHFEVRQYGKPLDPMRYLPERK